MVQIMTTAVCESATAPTLKEVQVTKTFTGYITSKSALYQSSSKIAVLLYADDPKKTATIAVMNSAGGTVVAPVDHSTSHGEGTDIQLIPGGTHIIMTGQGGTSRRGGKEIMARLTKIALNDGSRVWTKSYTAGGDPQIIFNECWGGAVMADGGYVMSCGTGIEGTTCALTTLTAQQKKDCEAGKGDPRPGAIARPKGVWQSMTIKTDSAGTLQWQRVDSYKRPNGPTLGGTGWVAYSSAGEWAIPINKGAALAIVTDQTLGVGLQKLTATATPTPATPTPTPKKATSGAAVTLPSAAIALGLAMSVTLF